MTAGLRPRGTLFAVALILAGTILFLDNLGIVPIQNLGAYWPAALVLYAMGMLYYRRTPNTVVWAAALTVAGVLLTLGNLGIIRANVGDLWPLLLIMIGVLMLVNRDVWDERVRARFDRWREWEASHREQHRSRWENPEKWENLGERIRERVEQRASRAEERVRDRMRHRGTFNLGRISDVAIFFSINRRVDAPDFQGGELVAVLGSIEMDLTDAQIQLLPTYGREGTPSRRAVLDATAVFGSIQIKVPRNWRVVMKGAGIFGSYDNKTVTYRGDPGTEPPVLIIRGAAVFGSVEVQN